MPYIIASPPIPPSTARQYLHAYDVEKGESVWGAKAFALPFAGTKEVLVIMRQLRMMGEASGTYKAVRI